VTRTIGAAWLILGWGLVTYSFLFPHYCIAKAVRREKVTQLDNLEKAIKSYHHRISAPGVDDLQKLERLVSLRDRVFSARNWAIDLGSVRDYVASLILPFLSFLAGAFDLPLALKALLTR
jgi:hypothetical protein